MLWKLSLITPAPFVNEAEHLLCSFCESLSSFEHDDQGHEWIVEGYLEHKPSEQMMQDLSLNLQTLRDKTKSNISDVSITEIDDRNWLEENLTQFPPLSVANYFIYGSHINQPIPHDKIGIEINAATAFGSGEHETTSGCLKALSDLKKTYPHTKSFLDMGCGSGILAIAMAKGWDLPIVAVDNDPECIRVTLENAKLNTCEDKIQAFVAEGFQGFSTHTPVQQFDIITANILAGPLRDMAKPMVEYLAPKGFLILSGLLKDQINWVLEAYKDEGAYLVEENTYNNWSTLVLSKD